MTNQYGVQCEGLEVGFEESFAMFLMIAVLIATAIQADTLYSTFLAGTTFAAGNYTVGTIPGYQTPPDVADAANFTSPGTYTLTGAKVAVDFHANSITTTPSEAYLETNSSGVPGVIIDTLTIARSMSLTPSVVTYNCTSCPVLTSGGSYWLVLADADAKTVGSWFAGSGLATNSDFMQNDIGGVCGLWGGAGGFPNPAFEIDGTADSVAEPSSVLMLGLGMLFLNKI
jgi:hypothetical protein